MRIARSGDILERDKLSLGDPAALTKQGAEVVEPIPFEPDRYRSSRQRGPKSEPHKLRPAKGGAYRLGCQHVKRIRLYCLDRSPLPFQDVCNEISQRGHCLALTSPRNPQQTTSRQAP